MKALNARPDQLTGNRWSRRFRALGPGRFPRFQPAGSRLFARSRRHDRGGAAGFTLIELMVVVGLLAILAILASNVLMDSAGWLAHYRLRSAAKTIAMVFQAAKMEAIKSNMACTVTFDQTLDDTKHYDCVAFIDANNDLKYDSLERVLKRLDLSFYQGIQFDPDGGDDVVRPFPVNAVGKPAISFNPRGLPRDSTGGSVNDGAFLVNDRGSRLKIVVNNAGSIRIEKN
ncbi:MAG: hypothetical protein AUK55_07840 [Syntrophobacteraceae bacterium CG2_30_61_12]|nr:MAG: hypothetical protein AUK55_07840 [Syntrophobacteraceae bacterium CG2_30_61_12]PIU32629.1 MAG: hypothetical protein COT06_01740 [Syntrophobacteraceae bacterium CG07_land_8_20_14_0_80_61_8]